MVAQVHFHGQLQVYKGLFKDIFEAKTQHGSPCL